MVHGAHDGGRGVHALEMLDIGGFRAAGRAAREEQRGGEQEHVDEPGRGLPEEDEELQRRGAEPRDVHRESREQIPDADAEEEASRVRKRDLAPAGVVRIRFGDHDVR